jgi:hypothetical protein
MLTIRPTRCQKTSWFFLSSPAARFV